MAQATWEFDIPSGVWKNHVLSAQLRTAAIAETVFARHTRPEPAFGRKAGETVTLTRVSQLTEPTSAEFGENQLIPEESLSFGTTAITIKRIGRAVVFTEDMQVLNEYDMEDPIQKLLRQQMELTLDTMAATAFKATPIKYAPTGASSNVITTNGTFGGTATVALNMFHLEEIRDYMYDTLKAPMINGNYIMIARTKSIRGILRDSNFKEWFIYTNPSNKFTHELGTIEGIRMIETNHSNALSNVGSGNVCGEAVVFGDDAVTMVEAVTPELRMGIPRNFGLLRGVAWYGRIAFGLTYGDSANSGEARVVHVGSA